jgi:predicted glycoside hydrolase/deacetylase ChbG (UPF0249 family)
VHLSGHSSVHMPPEVVKVVAEVAGKQAGWVADAVVAEPRGSVGVAKAVAQGADSEVAAWEEMAVVVLTGGDTKVLVA